MAIQTTRKQLPASSPLSASRKAKAAATALSPTTPSSSKQKRTRTKAGCITCRVRGKKCDEHRNDDGTCNTCNRLRLHCLGFVDRRPEWLRTKENIKVWRKRVTDFLLSQGFVKGYAGCGLRSQSVPERTLTLDDMRLNLTNPSDAGSDDEHEQQLPLPHSQHSFPHPPPPHHSHPLQPQYPLHPHPHLPHHSHPPSFATVDTPSIPQLPLPIAYQQAQPEISTWSQDMNHNHHHQHQHHHHILPHLQQQHPHHHPHHPVHVSPSVSDSSSPPLGYTPLTGDHQDMLFPDNIAGSQKQRENLAPYPAVFNPPYSPYGQFAASIPISPILSPLPPYHELAQSGHVSNASQSEQQHLQQQQQHHHHHQQHQQQLVLTSPYNMNTALVATSSLPIPVNETYYHQYGASSVYMPIYRPFSMNEAVNQDFYIRKYFHSVLGIQYRLADHASLQKVMAHLVQVSPAVKSSISLLSVLHTQSQGAFPAPPQPPRIADRNAHLLYQQCLNQQFSSITGADAPAPVATSTSPTSPSSPASAQHLYDRLYAETKQLLDEAQSGEGGRRFDEGDAMACLHVISAFLFRGGRGVWDRFLTMAGDWVEASLFEHAAQSRAAAAAAAMATATGSSTVMIALNPAASSASSTFLSPLASQPPFVQDALAAFASLSPTGKFIFRTTMWMDVFSGVSICRAPRFLGVYQNLFRPEMNSIFVGSTEVEDELVGHHQHQNRNRGGPSTSSLGAQGKRSSSRKGMGMGMDRVMGCPSEVVLAFAETAQIESQKQLWEGQAANALAMRHPNAHQMRAQIDKMVRARGAAIERYIPEAMGPDVPMNWDQQIVEVPTAVAEEQDTVYPSISSPSSSVGGENLDEFRRYKVADCFRNAARVYLHSVVEGYNPEHPALRRAVERSVRSLRALPSSALDRSLIFPITITGCLALYACEVEFCTGRLASVGSDAESFGNCWQARELIEAVWAKRLALSLGTGGMGVGTGNGLDANGKPAISFAVSWRMVMRELGEDPLLLV